MRTRLLAAITAALVAISLIPAAANAAPATWSPPSHLVTPLNQVWQHQEQTYNNGNLYGFRNYGWDQIMANRGYVNYCVRWDSNQPVSASLRDRIHAMAPRRVRDQRRNAGRSWATRLISSSTCSRERSTAGSGHRSVAVSSPTQVR